MPQPTPYNRSFSFTDYQTATPSAPLPGVRVDAQLDGIEQTINEVLSNLALIQRDDGVLKDGSVTLDSISNALFVAIVAAAGGGSYLSPNLTFVSHTLAPGAAATVTLTGVYPDLTVDIGVPKGDPAAPGAATLEDGVYGDVTVSAAGTHFAVDKVDGVVPSFPGHTHALGDVIGLIAALAAKADAAGTTAALAAKAGLLTPINAFNVDEAVTDAAHNGAYNLLTGATTRIVTFGGGPAAGHASIWVNRGTVNMTIACAGGYYKNGASATSAVNLVLAPGGKLTAFHEGGGVWTFDGTGF